jgi:hypothetical protein
LKWAAACLVAIFVTSFCPFSFNFFCLYVFLATIPTTIPSSSINLPTAANNHVAMPAFSKIKHNSVSIHEEQIFQGVLQQHANHPVDALDTGIRLDGSNQEEIKKTEMMRQ